VVLSSLGREGSTDREDVTERWTTGSSQRWVWETVVVVVAPDSRTTCLKSLISFLEDSESWVET